MSAPVCESKWQCQLNGMSGTAVAISIASLAWMGFEMLWGHPTLDRLVRLLWLWGVPFGPVVMSVFYAALMRWKRRPMAWFGLFITIGGAAWGVIMLNAMRHL